jgi:hypothetical protein
MREGDDLIDSRCWASCLGECAGGTSGEHLVSQALFPDDKITVQGMSWCLKEPKTIGLASLTGNILCRKHNSDLSSLDDTVKDTFEKLREAMELSALRSEERSTSWIFRRFEINGPLLESWFLKTFINITHRGRFPIGAGSVVDGTAPAEFVRIAFGQETFGAGGGLYIAGKAGDNIQYRQGLSLTTLLENDVLVAGKFALCGFNFFLSLLPEKLEQFRGQYLMHHETKLIFRVPDFRGKQIRSHRIDFKW